MQNLIFVLCLLGLTLASNVMVLTDQNYKEVIQNNPVVLIKFYAPWCGHCKAMAPEFIKAADMAAKEGKTWILAELDASENREAAGEFSIKGYPTIKLFLGGNPVEYQGDRKAQDFLNFIGGKVDTKIDVIESKEELENFRKIYKSIVAFLGKEVASGFEDFKAHLWTVEDSKFVRIEKKEVISVIERETSSKVLSPAIVIFNQWEKKPLVHRNKEGSLKKNLIDKFITKNVLPDTVEWNKKIVSKIFEEKKAAVVILFRDGDSSESIDKNFKKVAKKMKSQELFFVLADTIDPEEARFAEYLGITEASLPNLSIVKQDDEFMRYLFEKRKFSSANIKEFVQNYLDGKLERYLKSERVPTKSEMEKPVKPLVGKNYNKIVNDSKKDVLVKYFAPWCGHCKQLAPVYHKMAEKLMHNKHLIIGEMDASANDVPGLQIQGYPTIKFYPAKNKEGIEFEGGDRSEENMIKFIQEHASYPVTIQEEEKIEL